MADPYRYFRIEARELVEQLGQGALDLETARGADAVARILRLAHTLKGAARVVKQREIAEAAHAIEDALAPHREPGAAVPRAAVDAILALVDGIAARVAALSAPAAPVAAPAAATREPAADEAVRSVRADVTEVDALLEGLTETHVVLGGLRRAAADVERARRLGDVLAAQLEPRGRDPARAAPARTVELAADLRAILAGLERSLASAVDQMDRELRQVRDAAEHLRLVPAATMLTALERIARDTAQALAKPVRFVGRGGTIRLDAHALGAAQAALVQIVRNAVAHGIEGEAERRAAGKPPVGTIEVELIRRGRTIELRCRDDGRGIDLDAVRRGAVQRGLAADGLEQLSPRALADLLLRAGVTTSASVTDIAGRGVGLDVVREAIARLGGEVRVTTARGRGATFELVVPLSLASIDGLAVEGAGTIATVPLEAIRRTLRIADGALARTPAGESLIFDGEAIPFVTLARALGGAAVRTGGAVTAVIVEAGGRRAALGVDRLRGTASVVVRPLPALAPADPIVAGAALDADGNPQLILDPDGIVAAAIRAAAPAEAPARGRDPVLVVDDSLTTRMLERSILESAGYQVDVATSGEEALIVARTRSYALFLVDVDMPGMDGFTFIERVRAEPALAGVPAILVTSRNAVEDRARGEQVGAQGYIVKSEFDQADLLARIRRLVA